MQESDLDNTRSSKEMWLFLIFLDIAALCVFAYFIYNSFGGEIQKKVSALTAANKPTKTFVEEVIVETPKLPTTKIEEKKVPSPAPKKEEVKETAKEAPKAETKTEVKPETKTEPVKAEKETPKAEVKTETAPKTTTAPATAKTPATTEKKQSVFVSGVGKTRKVTFKYYGDAKKVSIVSGFTNRQPKALTKKDGVWETSLILYPGDYKYMYLVNNVETLDPNAPSENGRSVLKVR